MIEEMNGLSPAHEHSAGVGDISRVQRFRDALKRKCDKCQDEATHGQYRRGEGFFRVLCSVCHRSEVLQQRFERMQQRTPEALAQRRAARTVINRARAWRG